MAEQGYSLTITTLRRLQRMLRWFEHSPLTKQPPAVRTRAAVNDGYPLRLAKPQSGRTLDGSTPGTSALCDIYAAIPGSEVVVETDIAIYPGQAMGTGNTIDDTTYFICGDVNGVLQFVGPGAGGGSATSGGKITVEIPTNLALTDATKASCTVKATFSGGPAVASTVTITNPPAKGGNYQWKATAATQYVNAVYQGGSTYLICSVQHVTQQVLYDTDWTTPNFTQDRKDLWVAFADNDATDTVLTGTPCAE